MTVGVCLAGIAVTTYLTIEHYSASVTLACPETAVVNCVKVTTSPQSTVLGIPLAVLGLVFFLGMTVLTWPSLWRDRGPWIRRGRLALAGVGAAWVVYLVYVELFVVDAICLWCTAVHVLTVALFAVIAVHAALDAEA